MRITEKTLQMAIDQLNWIKGFREKIEWNTIGSYQLSYAYGGVSLHKVLSEHGAIRDVFNCGHIPKKDLYNRICAYRIGMGEDN